MSKQLLINERPADTGANAASTIGMGSEDYPKASIGNYKGVMLCNRPNDLGQQQRPVDSSGNQPFLSRVTPGEPMGWNPTKKVVPKPNRRRCNLLSNYLSSRPQLDPSQAQALHQGAGGEEDKGEGPSVDPGARTRVES